MWPRPNSNVTQPWHSKTSLRGGGRRRRKRRHFVFEESHPKHSIRRNPPSSFSRARRYYWSEYGILTQILEFEELKLDESHSYVFYKKQAEENK